ncbi:MAG: transposase [Desulfobulbaceae bacterium]|nr:transposase [Desulfobulbaceae bacterium]
MKESRFSESQIVRILKGADGGRKVAELCREHGMSSAPFYRWRSKFDGIKGKNRVFPDGKVDSLPGGNS